jgi:hypothetical protein
LTHKKQNASYKSPPPSRVEVRDKDEIRSAPDVNHHI